MMSPTHSPLSPGDLLRVVRQYRLRWIVPTVLLVAVAAVYAALAPREWEAQQALIVRNQATRLADGPGRFETPDDMKVTQETILELAKSQSVLQAALAEVGPPEGHTGHTWPAVDDVAGLQRSLELKAPKGAAFGSTEIFYLIVRDVRRERAVDLATAISSLLEQRYQQILEQKARSIVRELEKAVVLAEQDLDAATERLAATEGQIGSDLGELRALSQWSSGGTDLRQQVVNIEGELRAARENLRTQEELLELLQGAQDDPGRLLASPNRLLESQPLLRRLKEGLVDAQLRTAQLLGRMAPGHPAVVAARQSETEIGQHIAEELGVAVRGVKVDQQLAADRVDTLTAQLKGLNERLNRLAALRAPYTNQVAQVEHRTRLLQEAESRLSEARNREAGVLATSLISQIDQPVVGSKPVGPGTATIILGGLVAGLATGGAILYLTVPAARVVGHSSFEMTSGKRISAAAAALGATTGAVSHAAAAPADMRPAASAGAPPADELSRAAGWGVPTATCEPARPADAANVANVANVANAANAANVANVANAANAANVANAIGNLSLGSALRKATPAPEPAPAL